MRLGQYHTGGKARRLMSRNRSRRTKPRRPSKAVVWQGDREIRVSVETIDPLTAELWLEKNSINRKKTHRHVERLAAAIRRGEWVFNGEAIVFDEDGNLADGQHRLEAIILAGLPVETLVVRGVEPARAQDTMDAGMKRSLAGQLQVRNEENAHTLASAIAVVHRLTGQQSYASQDYPTTTQGLAILAEHADLRRCCTMGNRARRSVIRYPGGLAAGLFYLFSSVDSDDAAEFWTAFIDGDSLEKGSPIMALRTAMLRDMKRPAGVERMTHKQRCALTVKAWLQWRRGDEVRVCRWKARHEAFPQYDADLSG